MKKIGLRLSFVLWAVASAALLTLPSCKNDHCDELMYAPTTLSFYSEMDTSVAVSPALLVLKGVGTDSVLNCGLQPSIQLRLDNQAERCMYSCAVVTDHSSYEFLYLGSSVRLATEAGDVEFPSYKLDEATGVFTFEGSDEVRLLRWTLDDTTFVVSRPEVDTLVFDYTNTVEFVSAECGCFVSHVLKNVKFLHNGIGTVSVVDSTVTNLSDAKNVKIYLENY